MKMKQEPIGFPSERLREEEQEIRRKEVVTEVDQQHLEKMLNAND